MCQRNALHFILDFYLFSIDCRKCFPADRRRALGITDIRIVRYTLKFLKLSQPTGSEKTVGQIMSLQKTQTNFLIR